MPGGTHSIAHRYTGTYGHSHAVPNANAHA